MKSPPGDDVDTPEIPIDERAAFDRSNGHAVSVKSIVPAPKAQQRILEAAGLSIEHRRDIPLRELSGPISPKLLVLIAESTVVTGYVARQTH